MQPLYFGLEDADPDSRGASRLINQSRAISSPPSLDVIFRGCKVVRGIRGQAIGVMVATGDLPFDWYPTRRTNDG